MYQKELRCSHASTHLAAARAIARKVYRFAQHKRLPAACALAASAFVVLCTAGDWAVACTMATGAFETLQAVC